FRCAPAPAPGSTPDRRGRAPSGPSKAKGGELWSAALPPWSPVHRHRAVVLREASSGPSAPGGRAAGAPPTPIVSARIDHRGARGIRRVRYVLSAGQSRRRALRLIVRVGRADAPRDHVRY